MPNKRDDNKKQVAFWLTVQEREMLERVAALHRMNMTDLVKLAIAKMLMEGDKNDEGGRADDDKNQHNA